MQSPYVIVLDADDRLAPGALEALRRPLDGPAASPTAACGSSVTGRGSFAFRRTTRGLLYRHTIGLTALVRREVFAATGGFDPEFEQFEDWEHWVNALAHGWQGLQIDAVTVEYRRHEGSKHSRPACLQAGVPPAPGQACRAVREPSAGPPERSLPASGTASSGATGRFRPA